MALILTQWKCQLGKFALELPYLVFNEGEVSCVLGASGSGKSTLLHSIAGFTPPTSGEIALNELSLKSVPTEKRKIALVFQRPALFPHLTIFKNVEFALKLQKKQETERIKIVTEWLEKFEISALRDHFPHQISEGQAQRVSFARAIVTDFPVILLDEPFSALDVGTRGRIRQLFQHWVKESKKIAVLVTHHPDDATEIADRTHLFIDGKLKWSGKQSELKNRMKERSFLEQFKFLSDTARLDS